MPTIAELQIKVNTTDLDRAKKSLDDLAKSTASLDAASERSSRTRKRASEQVAEVVEDEAIILERAAKADKDRAAAAAASSGTLASSYSKVSQSVQQYDSALDSAATAQSKLQGTSKARITDVAAERQAYRQLIGQIDPTTAALQRLEDQQRELNALRSRGQAGTGIGIDPAEFTRLNNMIEASRKRIGDLGSTTGKTAKEINFAMRGLPAQFTDIAVSLQGGQAPLTVFLQQGGQIKDMFGGVGPALRAMGGYILGLINPLTVAAAALGTLAIGFVLGGKEASNFNKTLIATGNASGTTVNNFLRIQENLDNTISTAGKASQVLSQIAAAGNITAGSFDRVAEAAILWEKSTGTATEETVKAFSSLRGEPVKAVEELDQKYNFLTATLYQQITALQEQGKVAEATAVAENALANALVDRSRKIEENLGYVERAWNFVATSAKEGWDAILDVGRTQSPEKKLENLYSLLEDYDSANVNNETAKRLRAKVEAIQGEIAQAESDALFTRQDKLIKDSAIAGQKVINNLIADAKTRAEKEKAEYLKLDRAVADARRDGIEYSEEEIAKAREGIANKYKDRASKREKVVREEAAVKLLSTLKQQEASLSSQLESETKLGTQAQAFARLQQQFSDIELKAKTEKLTKEQQSLLANKEQLLAQQQKNVGLEQEIKAKQELVKLDATRAAIEQQVANDRQKYQDALIGSSSSDKEAERMRERNRLEQEYQRQLQQLAQQRNAGDISQENYDASVQEYRAGLEERKALLQQYYADVDALQSDWSVGAKKAFENYLEEGRNVAGLSQSFFSSAFNSMEDALTNFVTTGKLSFKDLTVSILSDLAKMATKIAANQILTSIIGSFGGGIGGATAGAASAATTSTGSAFAGFAAKGKAFSGGVEYFANGGAFTNSIVNTPTAFGTGRGVGVMGEAGPEAIVPLTRTSDGQLGVKSIGGGSSVVAPVSVSIQMTGNEGGANSTSTNTEGNGRNVQYAIKGVVEQAISMALKPGGSIWSAMNGR